MADQSLDILIRILTQEVGNEKAADILNKAEAATKKAGDATDDHTKKIQGMQRALSLAAHGLGDFGKILHFVFTGSVVSVGIGLIAIAINKITVRFAEAKKKVEEFDQRMAAIDLTKLSQLRDAADNAAEEMRKLNTELQHAGEPDDAFKAEFEKRKAVFEAEIAEMEKLIEKQEELAIARAQAAGDKEGEAAARQRLADRKAALAIQKETGAGDLQSQEYERRFLIQPALADQARADRATADALKNAPALADAKARLADALEREKKLQPLAGSLERRRQEMEASIGAGEPLFLSSGRRSALEEAEKAAAEMTGVKAQIQSERQRIAALEAKATAADEQARRSSAWATANQSRVRELATVIDTSEATERAGVAVRSLGTAEGIAARRAGGQRTNADENAVLGMVAGQVAGRPVDLNTAAQMLQRAAQNSEIQKQFLERIVAYLEKLDSNVIESLTQRLSRVELRTSRHPQ